MDFSLTPDLAARRLGDLSRDELLEALEQSTEGGIKISFAGKSGSRRLARLVRPRVTRNISTLAYGAPADRSQNQLIEGDNLQAMVTLYKERGHVDLILTDPPYNTGNDFRYNDRWDEDPNDPGLGEFVAAEDGARRTKWMRFMWPRLQMMKSMLRPGGVLAICIDHRELFRLGQMLDELFGEENRLAIINWQKSYSPRNDKGHVSTATEYVLVYAKDAEKATTALLPRTEAMNSRYGNPDGDDRAWKSGDLSAGKGPANQGMVYAIQSPFTGELHYPPPTGCWRMAQTALKASLEEWGVKYVAKPIDDDEVRSELLSVPIDELKPAKALLLAGSTKVAAKAAAKKLTAGHWPTVYFGKTGGGRPTSKRYLEDVKRGKVPTTYWSDDLLELDEDLGAISWGYKESGHSQTGIRELDAIVGPNHGFATVKPLQLFQKIIQLWCPAGGCVLDPFAGSGTSGHAVLAGNATTDADRRFIMIEQGRPEKGDSYAQTLTAERLQRVISGNWANRKGPALGGGYAAHRISAGLRVGSSSQLGPPA